MLLALLPFDACSLLLISQAFCQLLGYWLMPPWLVGSLRQLTLALCLCLCVCLSCVLAFLCVCVLICSCACASVLIPWETDTIIRESCVYRTIWQRPVCSCLVLLVEALTTERKFTHQVRVVKNSRGRVSQEQGRSACKAAVLVYTRLVGQQGQGACKLGGCWFIFVLCALSFFVFVFDCSICF